MGKMRWLLSFATTILGILSMTHLVHGFDSQGHRGARGLSPENTLVSFARALSIGVTTLELDVGATSDGVIVVTHNPRLEPDGTRDKNGNWLDQMAPALRSLTLAELKSYDVGRLKPGSRSSLRFPEQVPVDGTRIPTLEEVLKLIQCSGNETVRLNIETKLRPTEPELFLAPEDFVAALLAVIRDLGFIDRVTIQSFDWRTLRETQRQAPNVPTSYLTVRQSWFDNIGRTDSGPSPWTAGFDIDDYAGSIPNMVKAAGGRIWSTHHREVTRDNVKQAHDLGLLVKVWTANEMDRMKSLIDIGVDGIITDYPDRLQLVLEELGMPTATPTPVSPTCNP